MSNMVILSKTVQYAEKDLICTEDPQQAPQTLCFARDSNSFQITNEANFKVDDNKAMCGG